MALRWALDHPGAEILITGTDELALRREHLEGEAGIPALVRELQADGRVRALTPHQIRFANGSAVRWAAIPGSGDLSRVVVARVDGVLVDHVEHLPAEVVQRLAETVACSSSPPRAIVGATAGEGEAWMLERWPQVVDVGEVVTAAAEMDTPAAAVESLPPRPDGPEPPPRDARDAELDDVHRRRAAWFAAAEDEATPGDRPPPPVIAPERWREIVAEERLRRQWEAWRLFHDNDGQPRAAGDVAHQIRAERERCHESFVYFAGRYGVLQEPRRTEAGGGGEIPLVLWPAQRALAEYLLACYREGRRALVPKGRDLGATWLDSLLDLWLWWSVPGYQSLCGTYEWELVDDDTTDSLFGKLRYLLEHLPPWLRPKVDPVHEDRRAHLANPETGATIVGRRPKPNFGRGRRRSRVRIDEAPKWLRRVQVSLRTSLASTTDAEVQIGTPHSPGDEFHRRVKLADAGEGTVLRLPWWSDPRKTLAWYDGLVPREMTWEEREREHSCGFVAVSGHKIFRVGSVAEAGLTYVTTDDDERPKGAAVFDSAHLRRLPVGALMDFGSGPSATALALLWVEWEELRGEDGRALVDDRGKPRFDPDPILYFDAAMTWTRTPAADIAADVLATLAEPRYGDLVRVGGDPAGGSAESDGGSWQKNLRAAGLPMQVLPAWANSRLEIQTSLETWQRLMDRRRVWYHATRAKVLIRAVEGWTWDVPEGVDVADLSRDVIMPRKDGHSHPGDAGRYGVLWAQRLSRAPALPDDHEIESIGRHGPSGGDDVGDLMDDLLGNAGLGGGLGGLFD